MSTLTFPAVTPNSAEFGSVANTQNTRSELNGTVQTACLPGDKWVGNETFTNKFGNEARLLRAFLTSLRGQAGRFYKSPPAYIRAGSGLGTPLVKGAGQTGLTLLTDGWTANAQGVLLIGDYFQVGNELHIITIDVNANSGGEATLTFATPLRTSPADNAAITINSPKFIAMLTDPNQARWQASPTPIYNLTIAYEEALD